MIKLGIIGLNEGNGHPFSYSAIFNGYDPEALERDCPFQLIKEYLPREHGNKNLLDSAKVTHIWTQDLDLSKKVARVSLIPNIVTCYEDMLTKVDAVILARDDPWNHLEMAKPFLEAGVPIFIDKQLTATSQDLEAMLALAGPQARLMAGSSSRFTRDLAFARKKFPTGEVQTVHGTSRVTWMRYGHHLLEGIVSLFGTDILWIRSLSSHKGHDIVQIEYSSGMNVILEFIENLHLPIQFTCYLTNQPPVQILFQDFFFSFREMLKSFVKFIETGERPFSYEEMIKMAQIVIAGDQSKQRNGERMYI